jgi:hypothetical protein
MANSCAFDSNQCASCRDCAQEAMRTQVGDRVPGLIIAMFTAYSVFLLQTIGGLTPPPGYNGV